MMKRLLAAAAVLLVASGLIAWLLPGSAPLPIAFAEVHAAVKASGSVTCRQTMKVNGEVTETTKLLSLANGICRVENKDGSYAITDPAGRRSLLVQPAKKEAVLLRGLALPSINLYELLKNLPGDAKARPLPRKKLDGKEVLGFEVPAPCDTGCFKDKEVMLTVWADAETRLPVRIDTGGKDEKGDPVEVIVDQIVFDKALDEKLFSLAAPEGYQLRIEGVADLPPAPADPKLKELVVTPGQGVGPIKFGISREEVEKALGQADAVKVVGREDGKNGMIDMNYGSRGLFIGVSKNKGVLTITCACQQTFALKIRDFSGKTDKGIALGASLADVIKAHGEPTRKRKDEGTTHIYYDKAATSFMFYDDKLVQINLMYTR